MSTRGWYEYYTINPDLKQFPLSMQFFKWGDATPGNAIYEWLFFKDILEEAEGFLPVYLMDDMLKNQLQELYDGLPENFAVTVVRSPRSSTRICSAKQMPDPDINTTVTHKIRYRHFSSPSKSWIKAPRKSDP